MVVECNKCSTRFQLDSAKIPDSGIRVRCSRCKHAFFLQHPSQSRAQALDSVVEQAIEHEGPATPDPSAMDAAPNVSDNADVEVIEEEDDWEFNEELPSNDEDDDDNEHGDDQYAQGMANDENESIEVEGFGDDDDDDNDEVEVDFEDAGMDLDAGNNSEANADEYSENNYEIAGESGDDPTGGGRDPGESGSIDLDNDRPIGDSFEIDRAGLDPEEMSPDDLTSSSMSMDNALPKAVPVIDEAPNIEQGLSAARENVFGPSEDNSAPIQTGSSAQAVPLVGSDDQTSEDPENWDFFADHADDQSGGSRPASPPARTATAASTVAAQSPSRPVHDLMSSGTFTRVGDHKLGALARIVSAVAWVAFFGLMSSGVYFGITTSLDSGLRVPAFVKIGDMRAANIRGQWMDTTRMGTLYVVTGDLLNPGTLARAPGQAVQVSLLGQDGGEVNLSLAFAGRDVQLDALREMSVEQLWGSQRVTALALAGDEIGPGQSASFAAAFVSLPEEASHFQLGGVAVEQINEIAIARGVTIPVAPVEVVLDSDGIELDPAAMETEVGESEIGAEPRAPLEPKPAE